MRIPIEQIIPDHRALVSAVIGGATNLQSHLHGEAHWKCVAWTGLELARHTRGADPIIAFLFGLFHDSRRLDDGTDRDHGRRAAVFVQQLHDQTNPQLFHLDPPKLELLIDACAGHADGYTSPDPTIGACWDADRLNLCRLGIKPSAKLLSTAIAHEARTIQSATQLTGQRYQWDAIYAELVRIVSAPVS